MNHIKTDMYERDQINYQYIYTCISIICQDTRAKANLLVVRYLLIFPSQSLQVVHIADVATIAAPRVIMSRVSCHRSLLLRFHGHIHWR